ncbi:MAG: phosphoribosylformylglycinamidine synthase [Eubacterium sp.]|nr:phosphoribosylformylglycinamidine synthase [Eubacterium sp.]
MGNVRRVYVEKKKDYAVAAKKLKSDIKGFLGIKGVEEVRALVRYDVEGMSDDAFESAKQTIFSEPPVDYIYEEEFDSNGKRVFAVEALPGQFDQRADSAVQCAMLLSKEGTPVIKCANVYVIDGNISDEEFEQIKSFCINPVDSREAQMTKPTTLESVFEEPDDVEILDGFKDMAEDELRKLYETLSLAMTFNDFKFIKDHFASEEKRDPSITEIRVLDTYWSDHCRHTTFSTELKNITFEEGDYTDLLKGTYKKYEDNHNEIFKGRSDKYISLMDLGTIAARELKKQGKLDNQEESDEINACSIVVPVEIDGKTEEWLVSFKNETHNHPTEIEPFGGAATCLGGCIRDPLSGRSYVCQAMRITGAADPTRPMSETLAGKLPQKKIVTDAAAGYSSYGNQIGLATGYVKEIYHPDYVAKRMEIGAVVGAARRADVVREHAEPGDVIILLGGRTGRDGIGGATGSSKAHTGTSLESCGAEVQKGNAPTERKIQRMFRRPEVTRLIKVCNDFGAGGVSVAIGELADGLKVNLDKVPKKYAGLDGTEIAISESQERMAVVVDAKDEETFLKYSAEENLEAVPVAVVTKEPRLVLTWRGKDIVNISRAFLDTNGAHQETDVYVESPSKSDSYFKRENVTDVKEKWLSSLKDLNECSQKGLVERFDASIGAGSVTMPYGGKYQLTETQAMTAKLPVLKGRTDTVTMMSYGFDPYLSSWSPYHGAVYAVLDSVAKIVATGGDYSRIRFSFQEYFRRMSTDAKRWSQPMAALLGAYNAQMGFSLPSIGGKDSMSGTFNDIDVPPTLVSFAVTTAKGGDVITPELKCAGNKLVLFKIAKDENDIPDYPFVKALYDMVRGWEQSGVIVSAYALGKGGIAPAVAKMAFGNGFGAELNDKVDKDDLFKPAYGCILAEVSADKAALIDEGVGVVIGEVKEGGALVYGDCRIESREALEAWTKPLDDIFPYYSSDDKEDIDTPLYDAPSVYVCKNKVAKPTVFIPVFPGTNCEYDSAKAFENAGANTIVKVFKNLTSSDIADSVREFEKAIEASQIIMFPGGFSAGDEPEGSAKFFATAFRNEHLSEAVTKLLNERDGLCLGICNGFQALIKLGLVPNGEIAPQNADSPTLTYNTIGRHISKMAYTKVVSNKSPWLRKAELGGIYVNPVSHGEGRFVAPKEWLDKLFENGQVATQYVNFETGKPTMDEEFNVNGSYMAIEGITSPDGRVLGKMAHSERKGEFVAENIFGEQDLKIFESGVEYFK